MTRALQLTFFRSRSLIVLSLLFSLLDFHRVQATEVDSAPQKQRLDTQRCFPSEYPAASRRANEQGITKAKVTVDKAGVIEKVEIMSSSGYARLDEALAKSLSLCKFPSGLDEKGQPISRSYNFVYAWTLD
jgi:TonB family protein